MHCKEIATLPKLDLYSELSFLLEAKQISWQHDQICINCSTENSYDYTEGIGSLWYDWPNAKNIIDKDGNKKLDVPLRDFPLNESSFRYLCEAFSGTLFEDIYQELEKRYTVGRVRLIRSEPKTCLSWHRDHSKRIHYPIKTQEGCLMVIDSNVYRLEENKWYETDTTKYHTAFNGSKEERIHLVACILDKE